MELLQGLLWGRATQLEGERTGEAVDSSAFICFLASKLEFIRTKENKKGDPRWWRHNWKLHKTPFRTILELQLNYREVTLNSQVNTSWRKALAKDRQKKPLHHTVTGSEYGRGSRGLAGLLRAAAKVQGAISVARGLPLRSVGSKPQAGLPSVQHQSQERNPDNI